MPKPTVTEDDIRRRVAERDSADRLYNEALTAVDAAFSSPHGVGALPPPDDHQHARLNDAWAILPSAPEAFSGWRARLAAFVWRIVAPPLQRQQEFNSALVDHLNRDTNAEQRLRESAAANLAALAADVSAVAQFQSQLIQYFQQLTLYVDTKDRLEAAYLRREIEERTIALNSGLQGVSDELLKRWESAVARENRFAVRVEAVDRSQHEMRTALAGLQGTSIALKREVDRLMAGQPSAATINGVSAAPISRPDTLGTPLDSAKYVGFENAFRGSEAEIHARLADYLPLFSGASDVLDVGCGRGEFLGMLGAAGIRARGLDVNHEMVEGCRARGLDVVEGDAIDYLAGLPDGALGGLIATQVVEHLQPDQLVRFLETAYHKLRPGSRIVLETINPACWFAFFASYIRDITHVRPIHPDTLKFLLTASGFLRIEVQFRAPYPEAEKLQSLPVPPEAGAGFRHLAETFNANVERLNGLMFTYLDYAAVGERL